MTPQAFMHLPELEGRITPPEASGLRLTDEVLAAWDAQARAQGLPDDWRLPMQTSSARARPYWPTSAAKTSGSLATAR